MPNLRLVENTRELPPDDNGLQIGQIFEIDGIDAATRKPRTFRVRVTKVDWYPSPIQVGVLFRGAMVRVESGTDLAEPFPIVCLRRILSED